MSGGDPLDDATDATDAATVAGDPDLMPRSRLHRRQWVHRLAFVVFALVFFAPVVEVTAGIPIVGVTTRTRSVLGDDGFRLEVDHAAVARPGLAAPVRIRIERDGGLEGPIEVRMSNNYWAMWDENGLNPSPDGETSDGGWMTWTFDEPPAHGLVITFDARVEPARQTGATGRVAVVVDDVVVAETGFHTRLMP